MRSVSLFALFLILTGCGKNDVSWISIRNDTTIPIYALPYTSDFTDGDWIQPVVSEDFYRLNSDHLDGFTYFSFYYDSLIIFLKNDEENPIKFYKDGTTINYDPTLIPFLNPDMWRARDFDRHLSGSAFNTLEEKHIFEHFFCIDPESVKSLSDTIVQELYPAL